MNLQDADTDGSSQDCVILHVVDVAASPRLTKHSLTFGLRLGQAFGLVDGFCLCTVLGRALGVFESTPP